MIESSITRDILSLVTGIQTSLEETKEVAEKINITPEEWVLQLSHVHGLLLDAFNKLDEVHEEFVGRSRLPAVGSAIVVTEGPWKGWIGFIINDKIGTPWVTVRLFARNGDPSEVDLQRSDLQVALPED